MAGVVGETVVVAIGVDGLPCLSVLYSAPPIPAGICWNPQDSTGMDPDSAGMGPESAGIHRNGTGIELELSEIRLARYIYTNMPFSTL